MTWDVWGGGAQKEFWVTQNSRGKNWEAGHTTAQHKPLGPPSCLPLGSHSTRCAPDQLPSWSTAPLCPHPTPVPLSEPWAGPQGHRPVLRGETSPRGRSEDPDRVSRLWAGGVMNCIWGDRVSRGPPGEAHLCTVRGSSGRGGGSCLQGPRYGTAQNILTLGAQFGFEGGGGAPKQRAPVYLAGELCPCPWK